MRRAVVNGGYFRRLRLIFIFSFLKKLIFMRVVINPLYIYVDMEHLWVLCVPIHEFYLFKELMMECDF